MSVEFKRWEWQCYAGRHGLYGVVFLAFEISIENASSGIHVMIMITMHARYET